MDSNTPIPTRTVRFQNHHPNTTTITMKKQASQKSTTADPPPLQFHSPHHRSDSAETTVASTYASPAGSPALPAPPDNNSRALVSIDNYAPRRSPLNPSRRSPENDVRFDAGRNGTREPVRQPVFSGHRDGAQGGAGGGGGEEEEDSSSPVGKILSRSKSREMTGKAALGFRVTEVIVCLISFSVMAADKTQGWSGDSFDRYREYRFCLSVNIIGFVYAAFQACNLTYHLVTEKHILRHHLGCHFDFLMDQILAYLLIAASSAAATRVIDWQSNWGKDEFTEMASGSIATSFLAFVAFAISSLISGYILCTRDFA